MVAVCRSALPRKHFLAECRWNGSGTSFGRHVEVEAETKMTTIMNQGDFLVGFIELKGWNA